MKTAALQERRNRQILADIVRTYIETGEPVSSRAISKGFEESLSTATIRNVMADLEDGGFLYQPHTSAGRVPVGTRRAGPVRGGAWRVRGGGGRGGRGGGEGGECCVVGGGAVAWLELLERSGGSSRWLAPYGFFGLEREGSQSEAESTL